MIQYTSSGMNIQIKMFDDHITVESPGKLPGLVRADNIRFTHFSRNPKIAEFLKNYKFVKEQTIDESKSSMYGSREKVKIELINGTNLFQITLIMKMGNVTENVVEMSQKF